MQHECPYLRCHGTPIGVQAGSPSAEPARKELLITYSKSQDELKERFQFGRMGGGA